MNMHFILLIPKGCDAVTYDAVGVNCKHGATTENQGAGVMYMVNKECMLDDCVCVI